MTALVVDLAVRQGMAMSALRRDVTTALHGLGEDHLYDVQLVMTELVTNVLDHTPGSGRLRILRHVDPCTVTVEVDDDSPVEPVYGKSRLGEHRGRGIVVVDKLSRDWGWRWRDGSGKTVYAQIACS